MAFTIKRGATRPTYVCQLLQNVGTPDEGPIPNLDTADSIIFAARESPIPEDVLPFEGPTFTGEMAVLDPAEAILEYAWNFAAGDTANNQGNYDVEIWIVWSPGVIEVVPNTNYKVLTLAPSLNAV